jgi:radical SAM superfamily enzyme YgiQ (UPF0313 family)
MSIAAVLRDKGYSSIKLFDMAFHAKSDIIKECIKEKPDIIGLSSDSMSFENGVDLLKRIQHKYADAIFILGGVHPTIFPKRSLYEANAAIAVIGEGEATIVDLVSAIDKSQDYSKIDGIAYLDHDGHFILNKPRPFLMDLDKLPFPARDLLPMQEYLKTPPDIPMLCPTMTIFISRGCKGNCIYCQPVARTLFGNKLRHPSLERVMREIFYLKNNYRFKTLYFTDDEFLYNGKDWIEALCYAFIENRLNINWTCQARVDQVDEDLIKLMKRSGCYALGLGVESGSQKILNFMRKGYKNSQIDKAFDICCRNKIITTCNFMVGTPGESYSTIRETITMLNRIRPNLVRCSITTPTPGSDLYTQMAAEDRINISKLSDFDRWAANPIKLDNFSKQDIQQAIRRILKTYYTYLFGLVINPKRWINEFYFLKVLFIRYIYLLRSPLYFWKDIIFYINYFRYRRGRETEK